MAGLNLLDMIMSAQGGATKQQLGQQLGLSEDQTNAASKALLPALSAGLKANTAKPGGIEALLGGSQPQPPQGSSSGGGLLGGLLGAVMGGGRQQPAQAQQGSGMMGMLGNLLDSDKDGSAVDDIFEMVMKQRR